MNDEPSYRESHKHKGSDYHDNFNAGVNPHRAMVWELEKCALDGILARRFPAKKPRYLDFACGTGRIIGHLTTHVEPAVGIDISGSMLAVARENTPSAHFHEADITREDPLGNAQFDLITAFRFFPNAEPQLRSEALERIVSHLAPSGFLVFNNHKNSASLLKRIAVMLKRGLQETTMSEQEVRDLIYAANLEIIQRLPIAVLPCSERHMLRPLWLLTAAERLAAKMPRSVSLAQNVIYVCRKMDGPRGG